MSLWSRMKAWVHKRTAEVQAEQAETEAVKVEEAQMPPEAEPEKPVEFEQATDVQPTEPPEQEQQPDPQPEEFEDLDEPMPVFETDTIPYRDLTEPDADDQPDELPTIPPEQAQEYVRLSGTGATTVDSSFPHRVSISSPEYHVKGPSQRMGSSSSTNVPLGTPFVVKCTQSGGVSGGAAATCTYTYTCKTLDDVDLNGGDANSVIKTRITNVAYTAGTAAAKGLAVVDSDGSFVLLEVYTEVPTGTDCS